MSSGAGESSNNLASASMDPQKLGKLKVIELCRLAEKSGIELRKKKMTKKELINLLVGTTHGLVESHPPMPLRRPHKGPRNGSQKRQTLSRRRAHELRQLVGGNAIQSPTCLDLDMSTPGWNWSCDVIRILKERDRLGAVPPPSVNPPEDAVFNAPQPPGQLLASEFATNQGANECPPSVPTTVPGSLEASTPDVPRIFFPSLSPASMGNNLAQPPASPGMNSTNSTHSITIARGVEFHYSESDLKQPSSFQGLVSHPEVLYSVWDDSSLTWNEKHCPLIIRGVSIAMKHWGNFYHNFKCKTVWKEIKQNWNNFKVLMEEYESLGKGGFELKWSKNGELIPSHQIIQDLRSRNRNRNEELTSAARRNYPGDLFQEFFSYRKGGKIFVLTDACSIARRYTHLKTQASYASGATNDKTNMDQNESAA